LGWGSTYNSGSTPSFVDGAGGGEWMGNGDGGCGVGFIVGGVMDVVAMVASMTVSGVGYNQELG
jgi:hypothetical protein